MSTIEFWNRLYSEQDVAARAKKKSRSLDDAVDYFGDLRGRTLIDLGCGDGTASLHFASRGRA